MELWQAIALGVLQGSTEFIPVSSSGHLVLIPWLLGWPIPPVTFDAMVHWGTLLALLIYFWTDISTLAVAWLKSVVIKYEGPKAYLAWLIILATIPAAAAGMLLEDFFERLFASPRAVSIALLGTALLLVGAELRPQGRKKPERLTWYEALFIGAFQAIAIVPGISRSGSTIAAGIITGLGRSEAARFSFLLSIPIIFGAGLKKALDLIASGAIWSNWGIMVGGFLAAFISGYLSIAFLLAYLRRRRLYAFALYCMALGALGLVLAL
ncbi:MAG TPA: undecaprenyl-diphosphatase UppP [Chloroflexi bacterium]|nr:undecaprenyl-diphosphatase UppP [Chloroflexota bacterium]